MEKKSGKLITNSYEMLPFLMNEIKDKNGIAEIQLDKKLTFERIYIMWLASKKFLEYSRPIIYVDEIFLSGPNKKTLLLAVIKDSNDQLIILAYAVVESENKDSYSWFFTKLKRDFEINNKKTIFYFDRDKGIISATNNILPEIMTVYCVRNIAKN